MSLAMKPRKPRPAQKAGPSPNTCNDTQWLSPSRTTTNKVPEKVTHESNDLILPESSKPDWPDLVGDTTYAEVQKQALGGKADIVVLKVLKQECTLTVGNLMRG